MTYSNKLDRGSSHIERTHALMGVAYVQCANGTMGLKICLFLHRCTIWMSPGHKIKGNRHKHLSKVHALLLINAEITHKTLQQRLESRKSH